MSPPRATLSVVADPAADLAKLLVDHGHAGAHIALTGGSTPRAAYEGAAAVDAGAFKTASIWFGDERCVDANDQRSNYRMAKEALLDRLSPQPAGVYRIEGDLGPDAGADLYESALRDAFPDALEAPPALDLMLLGLGGDGHCASLFPGKPELAVTDRWYVGVPDAGLEPFVPRVSATLTMINAAKAVVFLVTGAEKADAVVRAFASDPDPATPASLVAPASGSLTVLLDAAAASKLPPGAHA
jgi:6-phosphogluconolactonase